MSLAALACLTTIVAPGLQGEEPLPRLSPQRMGELLREMGYGFRPQGANASSGVLTKGVRQITVDQTYQTSRRGPEDDEVLSLSFRRQYVLTRPLSGKELRKWVDSRREQSPDTFQLRLDWILAVERVVRLGNGMTRSGLQGQLEGFETSLLEFESAFVSGKRARGLDPGTPYKPPPIDPHQIVTILDEFDFGRLLRVWGWQHSGVYRPAMMSDWHWPLAIDGATLIVHGTSPYFHRAPLPRAGNPSVFKVSREFAVPAVRDLDVWVQRQRPSIRWGNLRTAERDHSVEVSTEVDLSEGLTLAEVRTQIAEFARKAEALAKQGRA